MAIHRTIAATALVLAATVCQAADPPWKWNSAQRLALRFDSGARAARAQVEAREVPARAGQAPIDVLDGAKNPELFFPFELLEAMVSLYVVNPSWLWDEIDKRGDKLLDSRESRQLFEDAVSAYASLTNEERAAMLQQSTAQDGTRNLSSIRKSKRVAEADALRKLRRAFGRERFDRFLYTTIAPSRKRIVLPGTDDLSVRKALITREEAAE